MAPPVTALERYLTGGGRVAAPAQPPAVNTFAWQRTVRVSADVRLRAREGAHGTLINAENWVTLPLPLCFFISRPTTQNQARVVDYDRTQEILVASGLRAGGRYGFSKVSLLDDRHVEFVAVHERPVRDIRCSPRPDGLVLTTSLDRQLRIVSTASNAVVQSYPLSSAGWSCCWDVGNPHRILAGQQDGTVALFDMRAGQQPVWRVPGLGDRRLAVHSLDTVAPSAVAAAAAAAVAAGDGDGDGDGADDNNRLAGPVAEADPEGWPTIFAGTLENAFVIQPRPGDVNITPCPAIDGGGPRSCCVCACVRWPGLTCSLCCGRTTARRMHVCTLGAHAGRVSQGPPQRRRTGAHAVHGTCSGKVQAMWHCGKTRAGNGDDGTQT